LTFDLIEDSGADPPVADSGTDADADAAILHDDAMDAAALPDSGASVVGESSPDQ
jgi:hypothetical protein